MAETGDDSYVRYTTRELLQAITDKIDRLEQNIYPRTEHQIREREFSQRLDRMESKLDVALQATDTQVRKLTERLALVEAGGTEFDREIERRLSNVETAQAATATAVENKRWLAGMFISVFALLLTGAGLFLHKFGI